ncbi:uncharacterized protein LOC131298591 [Rhododendron vialii]|uniref:uncharacterized protein LOC131298591 n=1 Tax=Rhododendron vialii TaxID=182163 RepID=UPI00265FCA96|nr:uncharacterized protein LOC131298591 [Rhododendron vialii]
MDTMEVEKQVTDVVMMEQKPQKEGDTSTLDSYVVSSTITTSTRPPYDYTEYFTTETVFPSDEALVDRITCTGKQHGFFFVIKGFEKCIKNRTPWMRFSCERSGKYRPFVKKVDGKEVAVKKRVQSTGTKKLVYLEGHSYAGRLSAEQTSTVVDLSVALVKPREILTHLKVQDLKNVTSIKIVYNG